MKAWCCCGASLEAKTLEEESPLSYHLRLGCTACANWVTASGRLEEITPLVERTLWSNEARHELDRLPPYIEPLVREEVESYAASCLCRVGLHFLTDQGLNVGRQCFTRPATGGR